MSNKEYKFLIKSINQAKAIAKKIRSGGRKGKTNDIKARRSNKESP